jgi:hypothetical protein
MESQEGFMAASRTPYPLRLGEDIKIRVRNEAERNRRSLNAELGVLIEEGLKWREQREKATA